MVTNQNGIGTRFFPQANFEAPQKKMLSIFEKNDIRFKEIHICPHLASENCNCRKPKIGLIKELLKENLMDKNSSFFCGDRTTDKLFARNAGIKFISTTTNGNFYKALTKGEIIS